MLLPWHYKVSMPQPENHLFQVQLTVTDWQAEFLDVHLPVWSPGSYLVREYAKHLQEFHVVNSEDEALAWEKISKNHWRIATGATAEQPNSLDIKISYKIFANELTVRTNHLDKTHGYFNGGATFLFVPKYEQHPFTVEIVLPEPTWAIATALPPVANQLNTFFAADFDTLVDSPFEIGLQARSEFIVCGIPHEFVIWGEGNHNTEQVVKDTAALIEVEADLFGGLPYDRYTFILHLSALGNGGLEHKNCCVLNYPRLGFRKESYVRFINLVAHEFFHTWNVKRIRPKALEKFDYNQENYTPSLWFSEGTTSYYDQIFPLRARLYDIKHFYKQISDNITRLQTTPGRLVQTLHESSFDAWIKLYRPEAQSPNSQISYYLKGELVSMLLDLLIRNHTRNQRSLDDVMRMMWQYFGKSEVGFTEAELHAVIESVAGRDLQSFFKTYLDTTTELDYNYYLEPFGLKVQAVSTQEYPPPHTGLSITATNNITSVRFVEANSPAQLAGIDPGDELLALNKVRVTPSNWAEQLQNFNSGETIELTVFKQDRLCNVQLILQSPISDRYNLTPIPEPSLAQKQNLSAWLGQ